MKLFEICSLNEREIPGSVKQSLTQFFAGHVPRAPLEPRFSVISLSKRIVGNLLRDIFFLRNAAISRDKHRHQKLDEIIRPAVEGAVKAMLVDHPEMMAFNVQEFTDQLITNVIADPSGLYASLSYQR